jgi:hypothetical protein
MMPHACAEVCTYQQGCFVWRQPCFINPSSMDPDFPAMDPAPFNGRVPDFLWLQDVGSLQWLHAPGMPGSDSNRLNSSGLPKT